MRSQPLMLALLVLSQVVKIVEGLLAFGTALFDTPVLSINVLLQDILSTECLVAGIPSAWECFSGDS